MRRTFMLLLAMGISCVGGVMGETVPDKNLILSLRLDEGNGLPKDSSVYRNNPTQANITWVEGKFGKGAEFDGKDSVISIPGFSESFKGVTKEITIEAWIYPTADIAPEKAGLYGVVTKENTWSLFLHYGYPALALRVVGPGPEQFLYLRSKKGITSNHWYHIAATYNSATRTSKIYLDGVETGSRTLEGYANYDIQTGGPDSRVLIGRYLYGASPFKGKIDEVKITAREKLTFDLGTSGAAISNREVSISRFSAAPRMDGKLDDPVWSQATVLKDFWKNTGASPAERQTVAYIGYDEDNLYVGFRCYENEPDTIKAGSKWRDDPGIFNDDCVEIFLSPTGRQDFYYHFAVNARGAQYDAVMSDAPWTWDGEWFVVTGREKDAWIAEIKIPFYNFRLVKGVVDWRFNLCRERPRSSGGEVSCWSCTYGGFHRPEKFGVARGINVGEEFFLELLGLSIANYSADSQGIVYNVDLTIKNDAAEDRDLIVDLEDIPRNGSRTTHARAEGHFPAGREKRMSVSVPVRVMGDRKMALKISDKRNRVLFYSLYKPASFPKLLNCYYEKSYYTDESVARLIVRVNAEGKLLNGLSAGIRIKNRSGDVLFARNFPIEGGKCLVEVDIGKLPEGTYDGEVRLEDVGSNILATESVQLDKLKKVEGEVKINADRSCLMVGDSDLFLLCLWEGIAPASIWGEISRAGFNTIVAPVATARKYDDLVDYLNRAQENNLKMVMYAGQWGAKGFDGLGGDTNIEAYISGSVSLTVDRLRENPALLAWYSFDEPYPRMKAEVLAKLYQTVKQHDPYHPVWVTFAKDIPEGEEWRRTWDIVAPDMYLRLSEGQTPAAIVPWVARATGIAKKGKKPAVAVLMGQDWEFTNRAITPAEQICQTYLACVYGAKGVAYWYNNPIVYQPLWEAMKQTAGELRILSPVLLLPEECEVRVRKESDPQQILHVLAKKLDNTLYVIAVNSGEGKIRARFDFSGVTCDASAARVMFENRDLILRDKSFEDGFDRYARHVYALPADTGDISILDSITITLLDFREEKRKEPYVVLPDSPNLLFNSSFEIATNPGWPDGWSKWCGFDPNSPSWFPRIGERNANFALDTNCYYDGRQSLSLSQTRMGYPLSVLQTNARAIGSGKYVYSVYLKGDRNSVPVKIWLRYGRWEEGVPEKIVNVTTEWQRYFFCIDVAAGHSMVFCGVSILGEGTIWIDSVQLEKGEFPTVYRPAERLSN